MSNMLVTSAGTNVALDGNLTSTTGQGASGDVGLFAMLMADAAPAALPLSPAARSGQAVVAASLAEAMPKSTATDAVLVGVESQQSSAELPMTGLLIDGLNGSAQFNLEDRTEETLLSSDRLGELGLLLPTDPSLIPTHLSPLSEALGTSWWQDPSSLSASVFAQGASSALAVSLVGDDASASSPASSQSAGFATGGVGQGLSTVASSAGSVVDLAQLSQAQLSPAQLSPAQLSPAQLSPVQLSPAQLSPAQLSPAQLSPAQLSPAQLSQAQLSQAQLSQAQLSQAQLSQAQLSQAQLSQAQLNQAAQLSQALQATSPSDTSSSVTVSTVVNALSDLSGLTEDQLSTLNVQQLTVRSGAIGSGLASVTPTSVEALSSFTTANPSGLMTTQSLDVDAIETAKPNTTMMSPLAVTHDRQTLSEAVLAQESRQATIFTSSLAEAATLANKSAFVAASFQPMAETKSSPSVGVNQPAGWQALSAMPSSAVFVPSMGGQSASSGQQQGKSDQQEQVLTQTLLTAQMKLAEEGASVEERSFSDLLTGFGAGSSAVTGTKMDILSPMSFRQPQWTQEMSQRIAQMNSAKLDEISVRLDPESLGSISVRLKMQDDNRAHLVFMTQHGLTKEMLENALPRLKEMLAGQGIELASAFVGTGDAQNQQFGQHLSDGSSEGHHTASEMGNTADMSAVENEHTASRQSNSQIDHYV